MEVQAALAGLPQIEPVWLPTYAPWLNLTYKLWRWLREQVLRLHRLAGDWDALRERVNAFLSQFAEAGDELLHYVGLLGMAALQAAEGNVESALEVVLHVLQSPAHMPGIHQRTEQLRTDLEFDLTDQQIDVIRARARDKTLDVLVQDLLDAL
jgi:hypothetical protein